VQSAPDAANFAAMRPAAGTWLLTHRPIWGFAAHHQVRNATLQAALAAWNGKPPSGISVVLSGHIHAAEVLSFSDKRAPQFVFGTGGTLLAGKIKSNLSGETIGGTRVSYGRSDHRFGFAMLEPLASNWSVGTKLFGCTVRPGEIACN
jgi:hypothetical protein